MEKNKIHSINDKIRKDIKADLERKSVLYTNEWKEGQDITYEEWNMRVKIRFKDDRQDADASCRAAELQICSKVSKPFF